MKKNTQLNQWLWKWHVVAGLISLPFMLLLTVTGVLYLFKASVNAQIYQDALFIGKPAGNAKKLHYAEQLLAANQYSNGKETAVSLPKAPNQTTAFKLKGKGRAGKMLYVDPYTAEIKGQIDQKQTLMYSIRKLHGEILLDTPGTLVVELVASWFVVLILTGLYVWWPKQKGSIAGFFTIRIDKGKRLFWRDVHAVTGFWLSLMMLAVLAGGMPWTDVFGSNLKWVQKQTDTGYPKNWQNARGLTSGVPSLSATTLDLNQVVSIAQSYQLPGQLTITLPTSSEGVYTLSNRAMWLSDQQVIHLDQYSGKVVQSYVWDDVGILMELRQIFMRFHQGEYGLINWIAMLIIGILFMLMTAASLISYVMRKSKGVWSIPKAPERFNVDKGLFAMIILLGILFPMLGGSLVLLWLWEKRNIFAQPI